MAEPRFKYLTKSYLEALGIFPTDERVVFEGHIYRLERPQQITYKLVGPA